MNGTLRQAIAASFGAGLALAMLGAISGCGVQPDPGTRPAGVSRQEPAGMRLVAATLGGSAALPASFGTPTFIAGNPLGAGVWIWNSTADSRAAVFFENGQGRLRSWPVMTGTANAGQRGASGFAVSGRKVWLGINRTVIGLNSATGKIRTWHIPATRGLPFADRVGGPDNGMVPAAVQALAVAPDGSVAVAMSQSSAVQVLDPASGTWRQVVLPAATDEPIAVGFSSGGVLGIGFGSHITHLSDGFMIARAAGAVTTTVRDAWEVSPFGNGGFLVGASRPDVVVASGSAAPLPAPATVLDPTGPAQPPSILPDGQLAFITRTGVMRLGAAATGPAAASVLALPQIHCAKLWANVNPPPGTNVHVPRPGQMCSVPIELMTIDAAGHVWIVSAARQNAVSMLQPAVP